MCIFSSIMNFPGVPFRKRLETDSDIDFKTYKVYYVKKVPKKVFLIYKPLYGSIKFKSFK